MKKIENICLIDDDMIFQFLTQKVICETKLVKDIDLFSNGLDAIKFLKSVQNERELLPDIILLDLFMPVMDGWAFLDEYRKLESKLAKEIPIFIVSSSIDPSDLQKSKLISSVSDFIVKPMTKEKFLHIIKNFSLSSSGTS
ncbi:response regulator [Flavobacterium sp. GT3R68]|uniref:response regulator n=1 Tax=Flavobacterium sp. GT3R68 TaxID=2594437 RepID=UPI000F885FBC|nr:response regulator [Flavobacterium sp. GT3R68]RTY89811.1 response regulator [Flavobacterium sp. GSN2]TRW89790.1 response regulator [Flavobacterium sp. GT3R68]